MKKLICLMPLVVLLLLAGVANSLEMSYKWGTPLGEIAKDVNLEYIKDIPGDGPVYLSTTESTQLDIKMYLFDKDLKLRGVGYKFLNADLYSGVLSEIEDVFGEPLYEHGTKSVWLEKGTFIGANRVGKVLMLMEADHVRKHRKNLMERGDAWN